MNITVTVKCFSHIKHVLKTNELKLEFIRKATTADLEEKIRNMAPKQLDELPLRIAVNHEFINVVQTLKDGDEVALIPPVQGG